MWLPYMVFELNSKQVGERIKNVTVEQTTSAKPFVGIAKILNNILFLNQILYYMKK